AGGGRIEDGPAREGAPEDIGADGAALQRNEIGKIGEAARTLRRRRHRLHPGARRFDQASLVIAEPEGLLPEQRPARREAILVRQVIAFLEAGAPGEEVVLVQRVIAVELPRAAA